MLRLNLVSDELKKEIWLRHAYDMVKRIIFIFLIFAVFVSLILFVANYTLKAYYNPIIQSQKSSLDGRYDEEVSMINNKINAVENIQKEHISAEPVIKETLNYSGEGIIIDTVKLEAIDQKLSVKGKAGTRDNLNDFKKYLEESSYFEEVNLPTVNIFKKENINFNIEAILKDKLL